MNKEKLEELISEYSSEKLADLLFQAGFEANKRSLDTNLPADDIFTSIQQLGEIKTNDNHKVLIVETKVSCDLSERSSRKKQFDIGKRLLQNNQSYAAGLFVFYDERKNFRLSLVHPKFEGTKRSYNSFKRYTFYVNPTHSNKTFINQFSGASFETLDSIKDVFSVAKVTYDFFKEYKRLFEQIVEHIKHDGHFPKFAEQNGLAVNDVAKKLLGQIVFLYFLQRKGWLGAPKGQHVSKGDQNFLRTLFNKAKTAEATEPDTEINFFNDYLEYLFYDALNKPITDSATSCYRQRFDCQIPFLNGGLFEPIPEYKWQDRFLQIPDDIFSNNKETGVLDIFDSYNFTIDENSADDQEVSVDPEMLGKVFENLLEENLRKGTGSFYTPREIVQYMVTESLKQYLRDKTNISEEKIASVLEEYHNECEVSEDEAEKIDTALKQVKVVDPACGSGAFLVGLLQEIAHIRHYCQRCYHTEPQTYYQIKKDIIRDSIYGVDLDGGAVDIARLRFWLSMVVDHDIQIDDIEPLPNLDYKLMQGNSLLEDMYVGDIKIKLDFESGKKLDRRTKQARMFDVGEEELETQTLGFSEETGERIATKLVRHHNEYFAEKDPTKKAVLKKKIDSLESELIVAGHDDALNALESQFRNSQSDADKKKIKQRTEQVKSSKDNWLKFKVRPYFPWRLHFSEVFENGGFDVVIGNPPYILEDDNREAFNGLHNHPCYEGKTDIWHIFTCSAIELTRKGGVISFIAKNQWLESSSAKKMRAKMYSKTKINWIFNFGAYMVFDSAAQQTMMFLLQKDDSEGEHHIKYRKCLTPFTRDDIAQLVTQTTANEKLFFTEKDIPRDFDPANNLTFSESSIESLLNKIESRHNFSVKDSELVQGIIGAPDKVFMVPQTEIRKLSKDELRFVKEFHTNTQKYFTPNSNKHIYYICAKNFNGNNINDFPNIKSHFLKQKELLIEKKEKYKTPNKPYFYLHRERDEEFFQSGPKIVFAARTQKSNFTYTEEPLYGSRNLFFLKSERVDLKYLVSILNSSLMDFYMHHRLKHTGDLLQIDKNQFKKIPIYVVPEHINLSSYVDEILKIKESDAGSDITDLQRQIDELVMQLYGLTDAEKDIIRKV